MKKRYILLAGIVAIVAGGYYIYSSLDRIVSQLVNKYGSEVTGTEVNLQGFHISPTEGKADIEKITIANPKNYKQPYLFDLNKIAVKVDMKSLTTDTIVIDSVDVVKPAITYEMLSLTQNNIKEIMDNINNYTKKSSSANEDAKASEKTAQQEDGSSKKVIIKRLTLSEASLTAAVGGQDTTITLPTIEMKNIGQEQENQGTSIPQVIAKILDKVLSVAMDKVVTNNLNDLKNVANENLNNVVGGVKDRIKELGIFGSN